MFTIRSSFPLALPLSTLVTNGDDILAVLPSELEGGAFDGGQGTDTLQLLGGGIFDLRVPTVFAGLEIVLGSDQDDTVIVDEARLPASPHSMGAPTLKPIGTSSFFTVMRSISAPGR